MADLLANFEGVVERGTPEADKIRRVDVEKLPRHIAVIMDGNGRWARQRGLPRVEGHRAGTQSVRSVVEYCARLSICYLTLYAFSAENWKRPADEVNTLWALLREYTKKELPRIREHGIRFRAIGRLDDLPSAVRGALDRAVQETSQNQRMELTVALNYSGRLELVDAVNRILKAAPSVIDEETLASHLYTGDMPDPDLLIRTSGEMRLSNFLLWQVAYSEIYVSEVLWPDFRGTDLLDAILDYQGRERRYGGIRNRSYTTL